MLEYLGTPKSDFFGQSFGGVIATMIVARGLVRRVATYGATFGVPDLSIKAEVLRTSITPRADSKAFDFQRDSYSNVAPHPEYRPTFWSKVVATRWGGFSPEEPSAIQAPLLIALSDHDFVWLEHWVHPGQTR